MTAVDAPLHPANAAQTSPATSSAVPALHTMSTTRLPSVVWDELASEAERGLRHLSNSALWLWPLPLPGIIVGFALLGGVGPDASMFEWITSGLALTVAWFSALCTHALWLRPRRAKAMLRRELQRRMLPTQTIDRVVTAYGVAAVRGQLSDAAWMLNALNDEQPDAL